MNFPSAKIFTLALLIITSGCAKNMAQDDSTNELLESSIGFSIQQCGGSLAPEWEISGNTNSDSLMIIGTILADRTVYRNGAVLIALNGKIEAVGCLQENVKTQRILNVGDAIVSPGLINPHDHIGYNHNFPGGVGNANYALCNNPYEAATNKICAGYRYNRRNEWRLGVADGSKAKIDAPSELDGRAVTWNELRHVLSGTTTIAGSGGSKGLVRNVDRKGLLDGLKTKSNKIVKCDTFPLGDTKDTIGHYENCFYKKVPTTAVLTDNLIYLPHVAEGIDQYAQNELYCLTGTGTNSVNLKASNSSFIHTVAATYSQLEEMSEANMTIVWSPRSNISLYGNTAMVNLYDDSGITIALSSDWSPSGSSNMLREMVCATSYNDHYMNGYFSSFDIWQMATVNAAKSLGVDDQIGIIKVGYFADIAIFQPNRIPDNPYDIFSANLFMNDVALVLKAGKGLTGYKTLIDGLNTVGNCDIYRTGFVQSRMICLGETDYKIDELYAFNEKFYPLYPLSVPPNEPTCTPARYGEYSGTITRNDRDGDGIPNNTDNCPYIFNPIRPMDFGVQPKVCEYLSAK